jgi:hypothetical protein
MGSSSESMQGVLCKSSEQLLEDFKDVNIDEEAGEVFLDILEIIEDYQAHLESGVELCKSAYVRLLTIGEQIIEISKGQEVGL